MFSGLHRMFQLFNIALLDLMQRIFPAKKVGSQLGRDLSWHRMKLILCHSAPGYRPPCWNQVHSPLKNQSQIPQDEKA